MHNDSPWKNSRMDYSYKSSDLAIFDQSFEEVVPRTLLLLCLLHRLNKIKQNIAYIY